MGAALIDVLGEPADIGAGWMTAVLEAGGVAKGATVTNLELGGLIGTGQMGRNARFHLEWDQPEGRPPSVVGKFPAADPTALATGFDNGSYAKECRFYREVLPTVAVRAPNVWANLIDESARSFVLIMEDLRGSVAGDQFRGLTVDEAALAVGQAAALHSSRWGDDALSVFLTDSTTDRATKLSTIYEATMEGTLARLGNELSDEVMELVREIAPFVERWVLGTGTPFTLVHMDFRPDNLLFGVGPDAPPLVVVDWATFNYGLATHDLAYLIGGGFEPDERASVERGLVDDYCRRMQAAGIAYDVDTCWRDYRVSSLWGVLMSVIATMLAQETERGNRMLTTMLRRHAQHALDLDALALLRQ